MNVKEKTIHGMKWKLTENISIQVLQFAFGIVLARLITPAEYGMVGMVTVLIAISTSLIDAGFSDALIRKKDCTNIDFNTVFLMNISIAAVLYAILYFSSGFISSFYHLKELRVLTKVVSLNLIINSFGVVQNVRLIKNIQFKTMTKISFISSVSSSIVGVGFALMGYGYWSLVIKTFVYNLVRVSLLHYLNHWVPNLSFSMKSMKSMFNFGYKLTISGLITQLYQNIYYIVIGKYFSAATLGFYTRARGYCDMLSKNITSALQSVSYPVLCSINTDPERLKRGYRALIKVSFYISCLLTVMLMGMARELILILIGFKWEQSISYLQIIGFSTMLYPLHAINLNMLKTLNRSDLFLKVEIIKRIMVIPAIVLGVMFGMKILLMLMVVYSIAAYFVNSYYSAKLLNYSSKEQIIDLIPTMILGGVVLFVNYIIGHYIRDMLFLSFGIKAVASMALIILSGVIFKTTEYMEIKNAMISQIRKSVSKPKFANV